MKSIFGTKRVVVATNGESAAEARRLVAESPSAIEKARADVLAATANYAAIEAELDHEESTSVSGVAAIGVERARKRLAIAQERLDESNLELEYLEARLEQMKRVVWADDMARRREALRPTLEAAIREMAGPARQLERATAKVAEVRREILATYDDTAHAFGYPLRDGSSALGVCWPFMVLFERPNTGNPNEPNVVDALENAAEDLRSL